METYEFEINGEMVTVTTYKNLNIYDVMVRLCKSLKNCDDINIEDCIFKGKKEYTNDININYTTNT